MVSPESLIRLSAGQLEVVLAPAIGGSVARFDRIAGGTRAEILRGCEGYPDGVLQTGSFPLVPYANRIRGGAFSFRGRQVRLTSNMANDLSPLHGQGWLMPWQVEAATDSFALLSIRHDAGEWPWDYEASQEFELGEDGLRIVLQCRNRSAEPMPCGLGQHPFFPCGPATLLDTSVDRVWTIDEQVLPVDMVPAEGQFDLRNRLLCGQGLDHGFGGWDGLARMTDPTRDYAVEMSSPEARYFQLYSPLGGGLVAAEPVSHANAAINEPEKDWARLGLRILGPAEEMKLTMRIQVTPS